MLHNFDEEKCGSKDESPNSMNFANEKRLTQEIPPQKNCNLEKEEISETYFDDIQMPVPIIQENMTPVGLF